MKAVVTVVGKDSVGILATVSNVCAEYNANIADVSQTILNDMFCMIMICDTNKVSVLFSEFAEALSESGAKKGLVVHVMHEDIFNSMHRI